ncbi:MAG: hypothetical protein HKN67_06120, partial [Saprospiraceae bacterium]|nr:hypothetical protein [Saprospiraceae bacterium]
HIPVLFHGVFMCESDSSRIYIGKYSAVKESYYEFVTSLDKVRESEDCSIAAGGLYLPGRKECVPFEYVNEDSISAKVYELDTIFAFKDKQVAKYYKGHLFLNEQNDNKNWVTWLLSPQEDGRLVLDLIVVPDKKKEVEEITFDYETVKEKEKVKFIINPTLVEFERILDREYFLECDILTPVNFEDSHFQVPVF